MSLHDRHAWYRHTFPSFKGLSHIHTYQSLCSSSIHSLLNPRYLGGIDTLPLRVTETGLLAGLAGDTDTPVLSWTGTFGNRRGVIGLTGVRGGVCGSTAVAGLSGTCGLVCVTGGGGSVTGGVLSGTNISRLCANVSYFACTVCRLLFLQYRISRQLVSQLVLSKPIFLHDHGLSASFVQFLLPVD